MKRFILAVASAVGVLAAAPDAMACGIERWPLQDRRASLVDFTPKPTSVDLLRRKRVRRDPHGFRNPPVETTVYRVELASSASWGFFDAIHGQQGIAPNGMGLHTVTRCRATAC